MRSLKQGRGCPPWTRRAPSFAPIDREQSERARTMSSHPTGSGMEWPASQRGQRTGNDNGSQSTQTSSPVSQSNGHISMNGDTERLARALGWFSLGLGLAQIAAPRRVANLIGLPGDEGDQKVMRLVGAREIASGFGILAQTKPTPWLWSRVGGDAMDLALLRSAMDSPRADKDRV